MSLQLPAGITSKPIAAYGRGCTVTTPHGARYTFIHPDTAQRFLERIGRNKTNWSHKRTPASAVHLPARRMGPLPTCIARAAVKATLTVERTPPPDRFRPSPALRVLDKVA